MTTFDPLPIGGGLTAYFEPARGAQMVYVRSRPHTQPVAEFRITNRQQPNVDEEHPPTYPFYYVLNAYNHIKGQGYYRRFLQAFSQAHGPIRSEVGGYTSPDAHKAWNAVGAKQVAGGIWSLGEARRAIETEIPSKDSLAKEHVGRDDAYWGIDVIDAATDEPVGPDFEGDVTSQFKGLPYSGTTCTGYACRVLQKYGPERVNVYGFQGSDNEGSHIGKEVGGHDFAVVDGRWIVDPWWSDLLGGEQGVFDLQDPVDAVEIARLYGKRSTWKRANPAGDGVTYDGATAGHFSD